MSNALRNTAFIAGLITLLVAWPLPAEASERPVKELEQACRNKDFDSCTEAASAWRNGRGVAVDAKKAFNLANETCQQNHGPACRITADMLRAGEGTKGDVILEGNALAQACFREIPGACFERAQGGADGRYSETALYIGNVRAAYARACRQGDARGCMAVIPLATPASALPNQRFPFARPWLEAACALDDEQGCRQLAVEAPEAVEPARRHGRLQRESRKEGDRLLSAILAVTPSGRPLRELERACEKKVDLPACYEAGTAWRDGRDVIPDPARALAFFDSGCISKAGPNVNCLASGDMYLRAVGMTWPDSKAANERLRRACARTHNELCFAAAELMTRYEYANDYWRGGASYWYGLSCHEGNGFACLRQSLLILQAPNLFAADIPVGEKVNRGIADGFRRGCEHGNEIACAEHYARDATARPEVKARIDAWKKSLAGATAACQAGTLAKCREAVDLAWLKAEEPTRSAVAAVEPWRKLCEAGQADACGGLARLLRDSDATRDPAKLSFKHQHFPDYIKSARRGCELGNEAACALYMQLHNEGGRVALKAGAIPLVHLQALCAKNNQAACKQTGKSGSAPLAIDASLPPAQRYMLAARVLNEGDARAAIETLGWLADEDDANGQYLYGVLLIQGYPGVLPKNEKLGVDLLRKAAERKHPRGAYNLALYLTRDRLAQQYEFNMMAIARDGGVPGAQQWMDEQQEAIRNRNAAIRAERQQSFDEMNRMNRQAAGQMDRQTVQRAWNQFFDRQNDAKGERVCAMVYEGARMYQDCMPKETFDKHYTPWGGSK